MLARSLNDISSTIWERLEKMRSLVYLDCFNLTVDELENLLKSIPQKGTANNLMALYNLTEGTGFEKTALSYGVRGCFYASDPPDIFCLGTRSMFNGEVWLSRQMMSDVIFSVVQPASRHMCDTVSNAAALTSREKQVMTLLATGASNKAISAELYISSHTVRTHLYKIYRKINVKSRMQASMWASQNLLLIRQKS